MTTSIQEIYESNKVRQYTQADAEQLAEARKELVSARLDLDGAGYQKNRDLIDEFFQKNRNLQVTVANIYKAVEQRKSEFVWFSPAQFEYNKVAAENPTATQKLVDWLAASQGKPGTLVNDGNAAYENLTMLLIELRGRPVDSQRIHEVIGRISFKPGRQLHYLPEPRKQDPRSHAATDDGTGFL